MCEIEGWDRRCVFGIRGSSSPPPIPSPQNRNPNKHPLEDGKANCKTNCCLSQMNL